MNPLRDSYGIYSPEYMYILPRVYTKAGTVGERGRHLWVRLVLEMSSIAHSSPFCNRTPVWGTGTLILSDLVPNRGLLLMRAKLEIKSGDGSIAGMGGFLFFVK